MLPITGSHMHEKHRFYMQLTGMGIAVALLVLFPFICVPVIVKHRTPRRFNTTPIMDSAKHAANYGATGTQRSSSAAPPDDPEAARTAQAERLKAKMQVAYML